MSAQKGNERTSLIFGDWMGGGTLDILVKPTRKEAVTLNGTRTLLPQEVMQSLLVYLFSLKIDRP